MKNRSRQNSLIELGEEPSDNKKRSQKIKRKNSTELFNEFKNDIEIESSVAKQRAYYENMHHLSGRERAMFDSKFTKPRNNSQIYYSTLLSQKSKKIVVATGPAGTGKTLLATEQGVKMFLTGQYEKLIFTRPSVSVDEDLGYLPGTLEDKMAPWVRPIYDVLYNFITPKEVTSLMEDKIIEIAPLGYMRGRTFKNCWIVADEMQNSTVSQMKMLMTRLGENSRLIVTGDLEQYDRINELNGLEDFLNKFKGKRSSSITSIEFDKCDILREDVVKEVLDIYAGDIPIDYAVDDFDDK
jgi:phosphate starvation-inducible PhoH-like protein